MSINQLPGHEPQMESFAFRRVMAVLGERFGQALDDHKRNPDYRTFTIVPPQTEADKPLARIRVAPRHEVEGDLQAATRDPGAYFDVGLPVVSMSTEEPKLAQLGMDGYFVLYAGADAEVGLVINASNLEQTLPPEFTDAVRDDMIAIPMRKRPA